MLRLPPVPRRAVLALLVAAGLVGLAGSARAGAPVMVHAPSIAGIAMEGQVLEAQPGSYIVAEPPFSFVYQWQRCNDSGADCFAIGVTGTTYTATAADIGHRLRTWVAVTGQDCTEWRRSDGGRTCAPNTVFVWSEATAIVASNPNLRPQSTAPPTISGTPEEHATLRAEDGGWTGPQPITTARQWERCDTGGNACAAITGATAPTYTVTREDVQHTLRVVVTASNARGVAGPVTSAVTGVVRAFLPRPGRTAIGAGLVESPEKLVIDRVEFRPGTVRSVMPVSVRVRVSDTRGFRIRGAVVSIAGVPASTVAATRTARTGADGWAQLTLRPSNRVRFRALAAINVLVRAYRADEGPEGDVAAKKAARLPLGAP